MPPVGFEPTISTGKGPQTYALDCVSNETGNYHNDDINIRTDYNHKIVTYLQYFFV
jgi:hypothetical protein